MNGSGTSHGPESGPSVSGADSLLAGSLPRVFNMPAGADFPSLLARSLSSELHDPDSPFGLSDATILVPTRRAAQALADAFLDLRAGQATLLPAIRTLGDLDPDEDRLADLGAGLETPPAARPAQRLMVLARMVRARDTATGWSADPCAALSAASALADLLDSAAMAGPERARGMSVLDSGGFDWSALDTLVPDSGLAAHWQASAAFLRIATEAWPAWLDAAGLTDPGERRRAGIEALARNWRDRPPAGPVIIAGSTGSLPVTRALMRVVARLPDGAVVLPGLDTGLSDTAWAEARHDDQHPQRAMAEALEAMGVERGEVRLWPGADMPAGLRARARLLNEALAPRAATGDWLARIATLGADAVRAGMEGLTLIEAAHEEEEADSAALLLREALERPGFTAALVTPDMAVARRVEAKLARWGLAVEPSAGHPLTESPVGHFLTLAQTWVLDPAEPVALAALAAHSLFHAGFTRSDAERVTRWIDINKLRGARKDTDLEDLRSRLPPDPDIAGQARLLVDRLCDACTDWHAACGAVDGHVPLDAALDALAGLCETLATGPDAESTSLWNGDSGALASATLAQWMVDGRDFGSVPVVELPRLLDMLLAGVPVRPRHTHPRLAILGPLEARMMRFDRIVLAGLDEGVWPNLPGQDPFLSRPMRAQLGLASPDARIGLSAHDFVQAACAPEAWLLRARRRAGSPTVPTRWLWRLKTLTAGALGEAEALGGATASGPPDWLVSARAGSAGLPDFDADRARPRPRPPVAARPRAFHATRVEALIRDPYGFYVRHILKLAPLDPLGGLPSAAERGTAVHAALECVADWHVRLPDDPEAALRAAARAALARCGWRGFALEAEMERLSASLHDIAALESERARAGWQVFAEQEGRIVLDTPEGPLALLARADRIDLGPAPGCALEIFDYKTGAPPNARQVASMMAPQLPLTALILAKGGFAAVAPAFDGRAPERLAYLHVSGTGLNVSDSIAWQKGQTPAPPVETLARVAEDMAVRLSARYAQRDMPYLSKPRVQFLHAGGRREDPVDHLARRGEWDDGVGAQS